MKIHEHMIKFETKTIGCTDQAFLFFLFSTSSTSFVLIPLLLFLLIQNKISFQLICLNCQDKIKDTLAFLYSSLKQCLIAANLYCQQQAMYRFYWVNKTNKFDKIKIVWILNDKTNNKVIKRTPRRRRI